MCAKKNVSNRKVSTYCISSSILVNDWYYRHQIAWNYRLLQCAWCELHCFLPSKHLISHQKGFGSVFEWALTFSSPFHSIEPLIFGSNVASNRSRCYIIHLTSKTRLCYEFVLQLNTFQFIKPLFVGLPHIIIIAALMFEAAVVYVSKNVAVGAQISIIIHRFRCYSITLYQRNVFHLTFFHYVQNLNLSK